jgi:transposase InsO family protein
MGRSACRALLVALRDYRAFDITCQRVLTDNGACYKSRRCARLCQRLGLHHLRTKPYIPQTNMMVYALRLSQ